MPQSLRSILGSSHRVKKKPHRPTPPSIAAAASSTSSPSSTSPRKPSSISNSPSPSPRKNFRTQQQQQHSGRDSPKRPTTQVSSSSLFEDKLDDVGPLSVTDVLFENEDSLLVLRDVVQAMRFIRTRMFDPIPEGGFTSTRMKELHAYRASVPPIVTMGHLHAVLSGAPTRTEREAADLLARGVLRKVRVDRRGGQGEALIEVGDLMGLLEGRSASDTRYDGEQSRLAAGILSSETREQYKKYLRAHPTTQVVTLKSSQRSAGGDEDEDVGLSDAQADELIRAGFLTSSILGQHSGTLHIRPEDRTTLTSIQRVSQFASGSISTVGGANAIHLAGGGGGGGGGGTLGRSYSSGRTSSPPRSLGSADLKIAIPGHGRYLKLASATIEWLREALGKTKWGECPESWLRERFEGGGLYGPRWKEFWGVRWEWVVGQAVGLGVVELFETGSVGRGVRALG